jgi:hypothetical protein
MAFFIETSPDGKLKVSSADEEQIRIERDLYKRKLRQIARIHNGCKGKLICGGYPRPRVNDSDCGNLGIGSGPNFTTIREQLLDDIAEEFSITVSQIGN